MFNMVSKNRNFKLIWGFWIAEKELQKRKSWVQEILDKYYSMGIREFFMWYNPAYWNEVFGFEFSPNGRFWENEQITSLETFRSAVNYAHSLKREDWEACEVYLTANFRYYTAVTFPYMKRIINEAIEVWVDGFIVWAPEILEYLAEIKFWWKVHISTIISIYNEDAIEFLIHYFQKKWLNLNRMIFPREVSVKEILSMSQKFENNNFEVFWHGDYCRYANGLCLAEHKYFARDLCGYVLKHWLEPKKTVRYDFKKFILDENISDQQKQTDIDNSLEELKYIFVSQNVVDSNRSNTLLSSYIEQYQNNFFSLKNFEQIQDISIQIYKLLKKEIRTNFFKYIYDGLRPTNDLHNQFIMQTFSIHSQLKKYLPTDQVDENIEKEIEKLKNISTLAQKEFENSKLKDGVFGAEKYYKFMLYNRTSVPLYQTFNNQKNIKVVKIPQRWRDVSLTMLNLQIIDEAIENPEKFVDISNISWKYFHYDISKLDFFSSKFWNLYSSYQVENLEEKIVEENLDYKDLKLWI